MAVKTRALEVTVLRRGRHQDRFAVSADPGDPAALRDVLTDWLKGNRWEPRWWPEFEMNVRETDQGRRVNLKVRTA